MLPLRLEIEGFLSYGDKQIIDFDKLLSTYVFIIQGKTGAGKSSILDGITFALYGKIPRFGREKVGELAINHGCKRATVSLEIETEDTSGRQRVYKITRTIEKYSQTKKISELEIKYRYPEDSNWYNVRAGSINEKEKIIEEKIIGIPYDIFIKTVILPQGRFAEFLLSTPTERTLIILKLTGLDDKIETIKKHISEKIKICKLDYEKYELKIKELKDITQDLVAKIQDEIDKILLHLHTEEDKMQKIETELRQKQILHNNIEGLISLLEKALKILNNIESNKKLITKIEDELKRIHLDLDKTKNLRDFLRSFLNRIENSNIEQIRTCTDDLIQILNKLREINTSFIIEAKNLKEKILRILNINNERSKIENDIKKIEKELPAITIGESELQTISKALSTLKSILREEEMILDEKTKINNDLETAISKKSTLEKIVAEKRYESLKIQEEINSLEKQIEQASIEDMANSIRSKLKDEDICPVCENTFRIKEKWKRIMNGKSIMEKLKNEYREKSKIQRDIENEINSKEGQIKTYIERINDLKIRKDELQKKYDRISTEKEQTIKIISQYTENSKIEALQKFLITIEDLFIDHKIKENMLSSLIEEFDRLIKLKRNQETLYTKLKEIEKQNEEFHSDIKNSYIKLGNIQNLLDSLFTTEINKIFQRFTSALNQISSEIESYIKLIPQFDDVKEYLQNISEIINQIELNISDEKISSIKDRFDLYFEEIKNLWRIPDFENIEKQINIIETKILQEVDLFESFPKNTKKIINIFYELRKLINNKVRDFENRFETLNENYQNLHLRRSNLESEVKIGIKNLKELIDAIAKQKSNIVGENEIIPEDIERLSDILSKAKNSLNSEKEILLNTISAIEKEKNSILKKIEELNIAKGKKLSELEFCKEKLKEKEEAEKILPSITKEIEILDTILSDFTDARGKLELDFRNYITSFIIEQIVSYASEIFEKLSGGRYSFELVNKEIKIRDSYFNVLRETKSLSGGETFIASLSLSLGLAQYMIGSAKFRCFFIDEGFGSLDDESIELVSVALEKLASEGFRLGIITHVDSMKKLDFFSKIHVEKINGKSVINLQQ